MHVLQYTQKRTSYKNDSESTFSLESIKVCQQNSKTSSEFPGTKQYKSSWMCRLVMGTYIIIHLEGQPATL